MMLTDAAASAEATAAEAYRLIAELYPICRSITGQGVRDTLARLQREIPLSVSEVPTGTQVLDWTVPREWNIRDAYVKSSRGDRVIDFRRSNLHVVNYSVPVRARMSLADLRPHLFSAPEHPDVIPYRTSYYKETWGFCLSDTQLRRLPDDEYEVCVDSSLAHGSLTYGEYLVPGKTAEEVLFSCHVCHPSLCNDNLSGVALAALLARDLPSGTLRYSYRFLFIPGTIGSITWLARNEAILDRIRHGLVLANLGDPGSSTYKKSRRGDAEIDRAMRRVLAESGMPHAIEEFSPYGYDERQFCSPGFDLPVGCFTRTPHGRFPEYHTSADNLDFVRAECLADSYRKCLALIELLEGNETYRNLRPKGEPQLGTRGLYRTMGGQSDARSRELALLWVLNFSDGAHSLLDIADRSELPFAALREAADALVGAALLAPERASRASARPAVTS
jgi:aminopeptidase-like protein